MSIDTKIPFHPKRIVLTCILMEDLELRDNLYAASQAFIYNIITYGNQIAAKDIHDRDAKKEFTFRPFRFEIKEPPQRNRKNENHPPIYRKGTRAVLEIISHTESFFALFMSGAIELKAAKPYAELMNHPIEIIETKIEAENPLNNIPENQGTFESIKLDVLTPMYFRLPHDQQAKDLKAQGYRLRDKRVRFPDPILLYRSIRDQISNYSGYESWIPKFEEFAESVFVDKIIEYKNTKVKSKRDSGTFEEHEGYVGKLLYFIDGPQELRTKIYKFLKLGTLFGAGSRTSMGFGQYEIEPQSYASLNPPTLKTSEPAPAHNQLF